MNNNFVRYPSPGASHHPLPSGEGFARKHFGLRGEFCAEDVQTFNDRRGCQEFRGVRHQGRSDFAVEVILPALFIGEGIEYPESGRAQFQGEPDRRWSVLH